MTFHLACIPPKTSHHHKRIVRIGAFSRLADKPELVAAKDLLESLLLPFQPAEPIAGPVRLVAEFTWPWLKGHTKRDRAGGRRLHTSKPDLTNVAKTLEDRLVALRFIEDDRAVVDLWLRKWWGDRPGITITIEPARVERLVFCAGVEITPLLSEVPTHGTTTETTEKSEGS